ncbi:MAG: HDOD domain-containing protein, partial [Planctomycetia bacterium]|nr:HDOD domain-containing protein [Planctomycetia bacterium]
MSMLVPTIARRRPSSLLHSLSSDTAGVSSPTPCIPTEPVANDAVLDGIFATITRLVPLPYIADQILRLPLDNLSNESALVEVIKADAAMTAGILRRVNSSYFGMTRKVNDLTRAATLLGLPELRNLALTVIVKRMFDRPATYGSYNREALWRHSLAVAISARKIARVTGAVPQHDAYIAGLLHHVGTLLIDLHLRSDFCELIEQLNEQIPTRRTEREILSFEQAQLGAHVARSWHFPTSITEAIRHHESPGKYAGEHEKLVYIVSV